MGEQKNSKKIWTVSQCRKVEMGTFLLWNGFLSHVSGFVCVENEVLSTYGKSALMHKKWTDRVELTKKKLAIVRVGIFFENAD